ncbi:MAG: tRNA pseudouridine(38-40) synthase TruA [Bacteroidales bacterium]|nr:tRNA pseudouridine(38-40) synthase TruA [Bacteroidales bacterium]MDE7073088.1 tRNA pseudouridine(38-40) synthase TruA [Bacteroidales bacterium]
MQRFFLQLSYRGAPYCGWQRQPNAPSVQESIEKALSIVLKTSASVTGCGRTDAGVNASCYYAHFDYAGEIPFGERRSWVYRLNALLDKEIAVHAVFEVPMDMHARFSAIRRTYRYYLHTEKNPFITHSSYFFPYDFDAGKIRDAGRYLCTCTDFTSFSKLHTDTKNNLCDLTRADFRYLGNGQWVFVFTANRFLRNMVRALVGTLLGVGTGRYSMADLVSIVEAKDRCKAGVSVPAHALFLDKIVYF